MIRGRPGSWRLLADTQVLVWFLAGSSRLSLPVREMLEDEANALYFSVESIREIAIKHALGRPDFRYRPQSVYNDLLTLRWNQVETRAAHVFALEEFLHVHRDPFDRLLLAQASVEDLTLLTADKRLLRVASFAMQAD